MEGRNEECLENKKNKDEWNERVAIGGMAWALSGMTASNVYRFFVDEYLLLVSKNNTNSNTPSR